MAWVSCANGHAAPIPFGARGFFGVYPTNPSPGCLRGISEAAFVPYSIIKTAIRPIRYSKCSADPVETNSLKGGNRWGWQHSVPGMRVSEAMAQLAAKRGFRWAFEGAGI
jgi:hypothetical protein